MSGARVLFLDRDGTLIEEPDDMQVDRLDKIRLMPGVIAALSAARKAGYQLVMVTNQDGLGTSAFPEEQFRAAQDFVLDLFSSQGITFDAICVCPHFPADRCECRKPQLGLVQAFLARQPIDRTASFVVGDRDTDLEFARNLGIAGLRVRLRGSEQENWEAVTQRILDRTRVASVERRTRETQIAVTVNLDAATPVEIRTGLGFLDHMIE